MLEPRALRFVRLGGSSALFFEVEPPVALAPERVFEAYALVRLPRTESGWARIFRVTGPWHARSTSPADALARVGPLESESRFSPGGPNLVRLHISRESIRPRQPWSWAIETDPGLSEEIGTALAAPGEDGPRLELYLRPDKTAKQDAGTKSSNVE